MTVTTKSVAETIESGKLFGEMLSVNAVVLFYGEMGAGKTHFIKGMAKGLGINDIITSPTFALVNDFGRLIHFDLFRIHTLDDLYAIGFYDYIENLDSSPCGNVIAIEWAENIPEIEEEFDEYYTVKIDKAGDNERIIEIEIKSTTDGCSRT